MRNTRLRYSHWPLAVKLMVSYSLLIVSVVSLFAYIAFSIFRTTSLQQINDLVPQQIDQLNKHMDTYVDNMIATSQTILSSPYYGLLAKGLSEESGKERSLEYSLMVDKSLEFITGVNNNNLLGVVLYTERGDAYVKSFGGGYWIEASYASQPWFGELDDKDFTLSVLGTIRQTFFGPPTYSFSVAQPIRLAGSKQLLAVVQVFGSLESIHNILQGIDFGAHSSLFVVDQRDKIVYSSDAPAIGEAWSGKYGLALGQAEAVPKSRTIRENDRKYILSFNSSPKTGWHVVSLIPYANLTSQISRIGEITWLVGSVSVAVACLLSIFISLGMTRPLRSLSRQVADFEKNDYTIEPYPVQYDEIGRLYLAMKRMSGRIRFLINEVYSSKLLKQEAEIRFLQSQMNPHFMFNTLESIRMTMLKGNHKDAENGIVSFGNLLKYKTAALDDFVPVRREVEFIESLLAIYKLRNGDQLQVHFEAEPELLDAVIPSLIIQPIVENAIQYGVSPIDGTVSVVVSIRKKDGRLFVGIVDEGAGMSSETLMELLEKMKNDSSPSSSIGLTNVYKRLRHYYGEQAELHMESFEGVGTQVSLYLPLTKSKGASTA